MNQELKTKIIDELKILTLLETAELVKEIEKVFGVDTSVSAIAMPGNSSAMVSELPTEVVEEKTSFDVILTEVPADKKISILKAIRNLTGLGLKESKDIVDNVPKVVKEGVTKEESDNIKKELEAAGAKVSIN